MNLMLVGVAPAALFTQVLMLNLIVTPAGAIVVASVQGKIGTIRDAAILLPVPA